MIAVSDTSPIHYLVQIGRADLLEELFEHVAIPRAVYAEMQREKTPQEVKTWVAVPPPWLDVRRANVCLFTPHKKLGDGEREAVALTMELSADALLMDDRDGIREARAHHLTVVTTLGILEKGAKRNLLDLRGGDSQTIGNELSSAAPSGRRRAASDGCAKAKASGDQGTERIATANFSDARCRRQSLIELGSSL